MTQKDIRTLMKRIGPEHKVVVLHVAEGQKQTKYTFANGGFDETLLFGDECLIFGCGGVIEIVPTKHIFRVNLEIPGTENKATT